ncbi:MAG: ACP S-malonyltransferase [Candidatus Tritonobacter lacicola]|nr:ACP S-malonyltransferase [Candidatus Tritonobacter lacicola]
MGKLAILFPGQGSQVVGMGKELYDSFDIARSVIDRADAALPVDLKKLIFEGPEEELTKTINVQPAITAVSLATYEILKEKGVTPDVVAGHSLGEYAALYAAGALSLEDTLKLVRRRGELMHEAACASPGAMLAIVGLSLDDVSAICDEARGDGVLNIANINSEEQIIISGEKTRVEKAASIAEGKEARKVVFLNVSGSWHCDLMKPAEEGMAAELSGTRINDPAIPIIANVTGEYENSANEVRVNLVKQICNPVRWARSMERMVGDGVTDAVEAGPGKVLRGLMRKIARDVKTVSVGDIKTLDKAVEMVKGGDE